MYETCNVVLDEDRLEDAMTVSGERTYSRTVNRALEELVRRARARCLKALAGSGLWTKDLSVMRANARVARERRGTYRPRKWRASG